ncbi:ATP-dependent RNA helicase DHX37/DHR1 [Microdochium nivale]|nr:ATP-dependent RNA helicase DHX37/DHR1 [Microdochium nivale]
MAKKFVPRQRKHKVLARQKAQQESTSAAAAEDGAGAGVVRVAEQSSDSNALEILPEAQKAAQEVRRTQLRQQLQGDVKISGKKAKRLEKYIDTKLKKDENRVLLAKLADQKIDTSLYASSRSLGQTKETKRQALSRALRERQAGIGGDVHDELLFEARDEPPSDLSEDEHHVLQRTAPAKHIKPATTKAVVISVPENNVTEEPQIAIHATLPFSLGSGLKRPLDVDDEGRPVLQKRQKRGGVKSKVSLRSPAVHIAPIPRQPASESESEEDEWGGLSSGDDQEGTDSLGGGGTDDDMDQEDESEDGASVEEDTSSDDETESSSEEDEDDGDESNNPEQKSSAFKAWAHEQRNEALGYRPVDSGAGVLDMPIPKDFKPRPLEQDPLPQELLPTQNTARKAHSVSVVRTPEIQAARLELPVVGEEQKLMEAIHNNNVVVVCGATGSGKTTQVPQFLFEAGYGSPDSPTPGLIGVTQPRKVAAVSMSKRVAQELGDRSDTVAYQIRFEGTTDDKTAIKFMTDGVLLREVASDISLIKYSAIIIDEAHERSVNTDILIGMLSRVVKLREEMAEENPKIGPLKLIIMSATFRVDDVTKNPMLFQTPPPILNVEGRQHPVTVHFARQTKHDYVEEAFRKITAGHRKLPPGGFLVFLTGHDEIVRLSKKLKQAAGGLNPVAYPKVRISATEAPMEVEDIEFGDVDDSTGIDDDGVPYDSDAEDEDVEAGMFDMPDEASGGSLKMHILPLYSLLPTREQMRVFEEPPEGTRQIILATNVAETSLTIPGIRYVFDCGRAKERKYNRNNGVQSYEIGWISKASANQRSGRAGRTGPGHCYRLYSSAVYERDFAPFAEPELLRMPIEGVVLQLKAMRLQHVVNFPFPTPPDRRSIAKAEQLLQYLSAITDTGSVTQIGTTMSKFPLPPRFARILLIGHLHDCLPYTVALVAGLSVSEVFIPEGQAIPAIAQTEDRLRTNEDIAAENRQSLARKKFNEVHRNFKSLDDASDAIKLLQVVGEFAHEPSEQWCEDHFVRFKSLQETQKLRKQITSLLQKDIPAFANLTYKDRLDRPSSKQITALKQMVAAGFIDQVAIRADLAPVPPEVHRKPRRAIDVPYLPLKPLESGSRSDDIVDKAVFIHPSSCLAHQSLQELPEYIIYSNLQRAAPSPEMLKKPKTRMIALTDITGAQLAALAKGTPLLDYGKPIKEVKVEPGQTTRECWVVPYLRAESAGGGIGWPLPARKVKQKKVPGRGWVTE